MYQDVIFELINKPAGVALDSILKEGDYAVNRLDDSSAGVVIVVSSNKLAKRLKEAVANSDYRYRILLTSPHTRTLVEAIGEFAVSVKRLSSKSLRIISLTRIEDQLQTIASLQKIRIKSLTLLELAGVQIRELGAGNSRLLSKKERNHLLDLLETVE